MITAWLIRNRDAAAHTWLTCDSDDRARWVKSTRTARARRRLSWWDYALHIWTRGGTRR